MYDKLAKYILKADEKFRNYILGALVGIEIKGSIVLDDHLRPFEQTSDLRALINSKGLEGDFEKLLASKKLCSRFKYLSVLASKE